MMSYCERLIDRFSVLWGKQKVLSNFGTTPDDIEAAKVSWEAQLRSQHTDTIRTALEHLQRDPPDWPPSLAQWIQLCKQFSRPEHRPALPMPPHEPTEVGRQIQSEIASSISKTGFDYLAWAKSPGSEKAVELLVRGAREDRRLADILNHHLKTDGRDCKNDGARKAIRGVPAHLRGQLARA